MIRLILIELFLLVTAFVSGIGCAVVGLEQTPVYTLEATYSIDAGFDGGATGLGIISASCILGIVWIEVTKIKLKK